ncbi:MAG: glucose-1-phosphate adenylyltransferase [Candidatus Electryonea clarkiae]|nr:glucose-1-phosphate adenylyltransferase [Candidatus Electryonea clarkiae]MDP8287470.1 glucose-1-phosphate adenylyltransferase [Candidatus Electryonea clarkiae]
MNNTLAIILGGGKGSRLHPLTKFRSKPAVPLAGKYRLIDIPVSNCINSDISRIFVLTQYNSASLNRHIEMTYRFDAFRREGFVFIQAAEQTQQSSDWFQGTADAVRKNLRHYNRFQFDHYLILSGDHIYRMDYRFLLEQHVESSADITVATIPVERHRVNELGVMAIDENSRVVDFAEKPTDQKIIDNLEIKNSYWEKKGLDQRSDSFLASMGIYLFKREVLEEILSDTKDTDFGKEIFPNSVKIGRSVFAYPFEGYWEDIGTIRSFYDANLNLVDLVPKFNFYNERHPIYTHARFLPPSKIASAETDHATLSEGCIVGKAIVTRSIIGVRSVVGDGSQIIDSIMMGADYYEDTEDKEKNKRLGIPNIGIGQNSIIKGAIIDKDARIGDNVRIIAKDKDDCEGHGWVLRDGIIVIEKNTVIHNNTSITFD